MATISEQQSGKDFRLNEDSRDIVINFNDDFNTISYYENLKQAIVHRLKTGQGELTLHPNYGSRLHTLIGQIGNILVITRARQYIREALLQEPRIASINSIKVSFGSVNKDTLQAEINVTPIGTNVVNVNIVYDFIIGGTGE